MNHAYLSELQRVLGLLDKDSYEAILAKLTEVIRENKTIFLCGNGGSSTTASHMANDLGKLVASSLGIKVKALSLTADSAVLTTWANDRSYEQIFTEQLENLAQRGDVVICYSGSGRSMNVICAAAHAKLHGLCVVSFIGGDGGDLINHSHLSLVVPTHAMQHIEDVHLVISHMLCRDLIDRIKWPVDLRPEDVVVSVDGQEVQGTVETMDGQPSEGECLGGFQEH